MNSKNGRFKDMGMDRSGLDKVLWLTGIGLSALQLVVSVVFVFLLFDVKLIPVTYCALAALILLVLVVGVFLTQKWRVAGIITKVLSIVLSVLLVFGCVYLHYTKSSLKKVTGGGEEKVVMGVYVLADSEVNAVTELNGCNVGIIRDVDKEATFDLIDKMKGDGVAASYPEYSNMIELAGALIKGDVPAIILKTGNIDIISDMEAFEDLGSKVKLIYTGEFVISTDDGDSDNDISDNISTSDYLSSSDVVTIYVTGIDSRGSINEVSRSDVNIIMAINKKTHQILMINTPRDYYVPLSISNGVKDKLTHAGVYGIQCSVDTLSMLYGIKIDYYVKVNFSGFEKIIDSLGGVDVTLDYSMTLSQTMPGGLTVHEGVNHFNGEQALAFSRERYAYSDGDRQRGRNQMIILEAAISKAATPAVLSNYTNVLDAVTDSVITNLSYDELAKLANMQLSEMPVWTVNSISVDGTGSKSTTTYSMPGYSLYVMIPDQSTVEEAKLQLNKLYKDAE